MSLVVTDAVVLHAMDYLDSSRILRLATRDAGVTSVLARGARRSRNKFGSSLDLFVQGTAHIQVKPSRDLQTLVNFDIARSRSALSLDLERFSAASAFAELTLRVAQDAAHEALFDLVTATLDAVASAPADAIRTHAIGGCWRLIAELGFAPVLERCCMCHAEVAQGDDLAFSYAGGGIVCRRCVRTVALDRQLPGSAREAIRSWLAGDTPYVPNEAERRAHLRLLREFTAHHVDDDRELRAFLNWERGALSGA
ncbi:MAG: DNA repair protein RecO [Gemmatimonadaceae bacterium]